VLFAAPASALAASSEVHQHLDRFPLVHRPVAVRNAVQVDGAVKDVSGLDSALYQGRDDGTDPMRDCRRSCATPTDDVLSAGWPDEWSCCDRVCEVAHAIERRDLAPADANLERLLETVWGVAMRA
jgi:hypothetical protein